MANINGTPNNDILNGGNGADTIRGLGGDDRINAGNGNDTALGGAGNDTIDGGNGADVLYGDRDLVGVAPTVGGNDVINGGNGDDQIYGELGDDVITGGLGADTLTGGAGSDLFVFASAVESTTPNPLAPTVKTFDTITDFTSGQDKIDLRAILGPVDLQWGNQSSIANGAWYQQTPGRTMVFADTNGDGVADMQIELVGTFNLTPSDFLGVAAGSTNAAPVNAVPATQSVNEDASLAFNAANGNLISVSDTDSPNLTVTLAATNGVITLSGVSGLTFGAGDGTADASMTFSGTVGAINAALDGLAFAATGNYNGPASVQITTSDGAASDTDTISITVIPVNDAPVAVADSYLVNEDSLLTIPVATGVLANDSDQENNTLSAVLVAGPGNGTVALNADGSFTYTPNANFNGSDSFTYRANDGGADSNVTTVGILVGAANDSPVATADGYTVSEDGTLTVPAATGVLANDTDAESDPLTSTLVSGPANGTLTLNLDGSFNYAPNANYNGTDSFTYRANDGSADSNVATVSITIDAVNDAPIADNDSYVVDEDAVLTIPTATGVLANDSDAENTSLAASLVSGPANGTVTLNADGSFSYTPNANFNGSDSFTYQATDGSASSNTATVNLTVNAVNDGPLAIADSYSVDEDITLIVPASGVLANDSDADNDPLTATLITGPANGTIVFGTDGSFSYAPNPDFFGADSFTYRADDGAGQSADATVSITVNPINDAPIAFGDSATTNANQPVSINVLANDSDVDSVLSAASIAAFTQGANGSVTANLDGTLTYAPNSGFTGSDSFTYTIDDGAGGTSQATVSLTVNAVNQAPTANSDLVLTNVALGGPIAIPEWALLRNDTDPDGQALDVSGASAAAAGDAVTHVAGTGSNGSVEYIDNSPAGGAFTYSASDGLASSSANVDVTSFAATTTINGTAADEILIGTTTIDTLNGGAGNDILIGGGGNRDTLNGGDGDDLLWSPDSVSGGFLNGGNGNDLYIAIQNNADGVDVISDTGGLDRLDLRPSEGVISLMRADGQAVGAPGVNDFRVQIVTDTPGGAQDQLIMRLANHYVAASSVEQITFPETLSYRGYAIDDGTYRLGNTPTTSTLNLTVSGTPDADLISFIARNSTSGGGTVNGGDGDDMLFANMIFNTTLITLNGEGGDDLLQGEGGGILLNGGVGNDTLVVEPTSNTDNGLTTAGPALVYDGGTGFDTLALRAPGSLDLRLVDDGKIAGIEAIDITADVNSYEGRLFMTAADVLALSAETDQLVVRGGVGDDVFLFGTWTQGSNQVVSGENYVTLTSGSAVVLVDTDVSLSVETLIVPAGASASSDFLL